jgi:hypothetical protein
MPAPWSFTVYEKLRAIFSRMKHCRLPLPADDADAA